MGHQLITDPAAFDLEAYFARIGYDGPRAATLEVLRELHLRHPLAIPFENLDPLLRRPVSLQTGDLVRKLVHDGRGGYCFEHNLLLAHALDALGFRFRGLAARVVYSAAGRGVTPRSHMLLAIDLGDTPVIADVGFGGLTLTGPLALTPDVEQRTPHEDFRLAADDGVYQMEARIGGSWTALYRFTLDTAYLPDYEMTSWYLCHFPASHFRTGLMAARPLAGGRYALRNHVLTRHVLSQASERRLLTDAATLREALVTEIGIRLPDDPELEATLERIAASSGAVLPGPSHQPGV